MNPLTELYTRFSHIPAEKIPHVLLLMAPGALFGIGAALVSIFLRDTAITLIQRYLADHHQYQTPAKWSIRTLQAIGTWFIWLTGLYIAIQSMPLMEAIDRPAQKFYTFFIFIQLGLIAANLLKHWAQEFTTAHRKTDAARVTMVGSLVRVGHLIIWVIVFILLLNNYGVDVSAMVAGLGVGGLAVAFAFQNILKDIFGSFSIVFDKPFVIGDTINTGDFTGTVEEIGTKTTRLRAISGELIVISNNDLLSTRIRNYGNQYERRVVFTVRVQYGTPAAKIEKIPTIIKDLVTSYEDTRFDRAHFEKFTDYGLQFEAVYIVLTADYGRMMDIQQEINLNLYKRFEKEGIRFAVPIQNMLSTEDSPTPASKPRKR